MPSISYPTSLNIDGPWILDAKNLEDLDRLADSCWNSMCEKRAALIESALANWKEKRLTSEPVLKKTGELEDERQEREHLEKMYPFEVKSRKIVVYLSGGRSAEGQIFGELTALASVHEEIPRGFDLSMEVARSKLNVRVEPDYSGALELRISTSSNEDPYAQELFGKLQNWATEIQPKRWLHWWLTLRPLSYILSGLTLLAMWAAFLISINPITVADPGPGPLHRQAWDLLKEGITQANEAKAIGILLAMESDYGASPVKTTRRTIRFQVWIYLGLALIVSAAFRVAPKGAIGLWDGRRKVARQRKWIRIVSVSIPSLVLTSILIPWLVRLAGGPK
jgi:hypothetical protein